MKPLAFLVGAALALAAVTGAAAETYPSHPVTMIVPYPAGGPTDTLARILAEHMKTTLGQPIIIENVSGAGGSIGVGAGRARRARRLHAQHRPLEHPRRARRHDESPLRRAERFRADRDARRHADLDGRRARTCRPNNLIELIAWLKAQNKATAGTVGVGGASDVTGAFFPAGHRHAIPVRAVPRLGAAQPGPGGRPHRPQPRHGGGELSAGARATRSRPTP